MHVSGFLFFCASFFQQGTVSFSFTLPLPPTPMQWTNPFHLSALKVAKRESRRNWADMDEIETHPVIAAAVILSGGLPYAWSYYRGSLSSVCGSATGNSLCAIFNLCSSPHNNFEALEMRACESSRRGVFSLKWWQNRVKRWGWKVEQYTHS